MSLYEKWTEMVVEYVKTKGEKVFWEEYSKIETEIYKKLLSNHKDIKKTSVTKLSKEFNSAVEFIVGFVDGINES